MFLYFLEMNGALFRDEAKAVKINTVRMINCLIILLRYGII